jgi:hypothetical protein
MILRIVNSLRGFRKQQDGNATVEFAVYFTVFFAILAAGVEVAYMNLRHAMLERGVDLAVRDIRLNTERIPTYTDVRETICAEATVLDACDGNLQLEMVEVDPRAFAGMGAQADCRNAAEEPRPYRNFVAGRENQLMLLRACLKYKPMLPFTSLGAELETDDDGYAHMLVTSAFVQEPR